MSIVQVLAAVDDGYPVVNNATGGDVIYRIGKWQYHKFTSAGTFEFTVMGNGSLPVKLYVASGGDGGFSADGRAGGGDAPTNGASGAPGGMYGFQGALTANNFGINSPKTVTIGAGGSPGFGGSASQIGIHGATNYSNTNGGAGGSGGAAGSSYTNALDGNSGGNGQNMSTEFPNERGYFSGGGGGGGGGAGDVASNQGGGGAGNGGGGDGGGGGAGYDPNNANNGGSGGSGGSGIVLVKFQYAN